MRLQERTGRSPLVITWQRVIIAILLLSLHLRSEPSYSAVDNVLTIQTSFQGSTYLRDSFFFPPDTMGAGALYVCGAGEWIVGGIRSLGHASGQFLSLPDGIAQNNLAHGVYLGLVSFGLGILTGACMVP